MGNPCGLIYHSRAPLDHFLPPPIPPIHRPLADVVPVVILRAAFDDRLPERDVDPPPPCLGALALRDAVQPMRLRAASHEDHVAAVERDLERFIRDPPGFWSFAGGG